MPGLDVNTGSIRRGQREPTISQQKNKERRITIMGSVKYEVLHNCPGFRGDVQNPPSTNTIEQYKTHAIRFGQWCKAAYGCRRVEQMAAHIQDYADELVRAREVRGHHPHLHRRLLLCMAGAALFHPQATAPLLRRNPQPRGKGGGPSRRRGTGCLAAPASIWRRWSASGEGSTLDYGVGT